MLIQYIPDINIDETHCTHHSAALIVTVVLSTSQHSYVSRAIITSGSPLWSGPYPAMTGVREHPCPPFMKLYTKKLLKVWLVLNAGFSFVIKYFFASKL